MKKKFTEWSLGKTNSKFIPKGGEILKSIGSEMLLIKFTKDGEKWTTEKPQPVVIDYIGDFEPMSGTYLLKYHSGQEEKGEERITPEGFSYNNPDEDGWMHRWITYSLHFRIMEEEMYYGRLKELYQGNHGVLGIDQLKALGKENLQNFNYIAAVIDTDTETGLKDGIYSFRISEIGKLDKRARSWMFGIKDSAGNYMNVLKYQEKDGTWICKDFSVSGTVIGDLKIIDIENERGS